MAQDTITTLIRLAAKRFGADEAVLKPDDDLFERLGIDRVPADGIRTGWKQLHRTDAVPPDGRQQIEGLGRTRTEPASQPTTDVGTVGQQVVEVVRHCVAAQFEARAERQRHRQGPAFFRLRPGLVVAEHWRAGPQR